MCQLAPVMPGPHDVLPSEVDAFADRMLDILNGGALALVISVGHRTGLLDALADLPRSTSRVIADSASLDERYVREWLGAMVTGGIVEFDAASGTYWLPRERAALLTRRSSPDNMAVTAQWIAVAAQVEDRIVDCFRSGGGVAYEHFHRFDDVMAEESRQTVVVALFDSILPLVPGLAERLEEGIDVLDVGCGQGRALITLASEFPNSRFRGFDLSADAVTTARATVDELGLRNVELEVNDAAELHRTAEFDLVTGFDVVHDQARPAAVLANIRRSLRPDGVFLMQDIATSSRLENNVEHPIGPLLYATSLFHCMTVSLAQDGAGLGTCWGRELATEMLSEAGFGEVEVHDLPHDFINYFYVARP